MILFKPEHVPMILSGQKTQTRRLWKKPRVKVGSIHKCYSGGLPISRCKPCGGLGTGNDWIGGPRMQIRVCGKCNGTGRLQPFASVRIKRVWRHPMYEITVQEVTAEGYPDKTQLAFILLFAKINNLDSAFAIHCLAYAIEFELVEVQGV